MRVLGQLLGTLLLAFGVVCHGEVIDQSDHGFSLRHEIVTELTPEELYAAIVEDFAKWWNPAHSYSGIAENLYVDATAGGCFCENLAEDGSVEHMNVVFAQPGKVLRMYGGLGPLQSIAATGPLEWKIDATDKGAKLTVTYHVGGYKKGGLQSWAAPVDGVIGEQVLRLQAHAERLFNHAGEEQ